jgi:hypothetical protein
MSAMPPITPPTMAPIGVEDVLCDPIVGSGEVLGVEVEVGAVAAFWVAPGGRRTVDVPPAEGCWVT